ncbi:MAG: hypothetical protein COU85_01370 [Candidatus Portnoybacteria bacterium CG10_big_fil_rev_8_21_14_0_10_44_7]|uniref:Uncharacterized protein n=1 Tax=Candidatus Portnoybacteria bacterium CG10_big_fil_rev_8_21_14_0_10_44_7 TaxID=1974816 RepID=A0A2M8KIY4_9BACT|nr:MAG: hypothetical protein COU85_01370 [Candidatus Portnoybacteria bacterium CG10_big_fil_rev_8_21_14_0_10_44_7]
MLSFLTFGLLAFYTYFYFNRKQAINKKEPDLKTSTNWFGSPKGICPATIRCGMLLFLTARFARRKIRQTPQKNY